MNAVVCNSVNFFNFAVTGKAIFCLFKPISGNVTRAVPNWKKYGSKPLMPDLDTLEYAHSVNLSFVHGQDSEAVLSKLESF